MDFDNTCGYWIYLRPYVWVQGKTVDKCRRLYLVYPEERVYTYTRRGYWTGPNSPPVRFSKRKVPLESLHLIPGKEQKVSMMDLWAEPDTIESCGWVTRYFGVRTVEPLDDVRVNGSPVKKREDVVSYLKAARIVPHIPNFLKHHK